MKFVSIVCSNAASGGLIPHITFEDVKLTSVLPENVIGVMRNIPSREDILLRQRTFSAIDARAEEELDRLSFDLHNINDIYSAYNKAVSEKEKQYIFAALLYNTCCFYKDCAALCCKEGFFSEFSEFFGGLCTADGFEEMFGQARRVYSLLLRSFGVKICSDYIVIDKTAKEGYISILTERAKEMGISLSERDFKQRSLCTPFVEAQAELFPEIWAELKQLYDRFRTYPDAGVVGYIDQLDFYLYNIQLRRSYSELGIPSCFAQITDRTEINIAEARDISLLSKSCYDIIPNDIEFSDREPVFFLAGANGGGKTTYLRTCGINVILALSGCPVPARAAKVCVLDSVYTHFPKDERFEFDGRFLDEQKRVDEILTSSCDRALVLLNETYSTTNEAKSAEMTAKLAKELRDKGHFCVYVTHQKQIYSLDIPLLSCAVDVNDENKRTYRICRVDGRVGSHAEDVLKKYSLSRRDLEERFGDLR